jgi:hypothetical protein
MNLRLATRGGLFGSFWFALPAIARAFESMAGLVAQAEQQTGGAKVSQSDGTSFILPALVTVALLGLALFVVCRSSRRV